MGPPFIVIIAVIVLFVIVAFLRRRAPEPTAPASHPYERRPFLSAAERSFLGVLDQAVEDHYRVFAKVRLGDLLKVRSGMIPRENAVARNRIQSKHVDFVLCSPHDLGAVAAVELDDSSHAKPDRQERDGFVDRALGAAEIRVHHFAAKARYSVHDIRRQLGLSPAHVDAGQEPSASAEATEDVDAGPPPVVNAPRSCPTCGKEMVERTARRGPRKGKAFLACSGYPACRTTSEL